MSGVISIPEYISIDVASYDFFAKLCADTMFHRNSRIEVDFSLCRFFEGNMFAVLGSLLEDLKRRNNLIFLTNTSSAIKNFILKNGFLSRFEDIADNNPHQTTSIRYKRFKIEEEVAIKDYLEIQLFSKQNLPFISDALKREIIKSIFEIYANALTHGESDFVFSCGQLISKQTLNFTFVDLGHTIKNKVIEFLKRSMTGSEAISWATSDRNTTKTGNHSGGFGLKLIQQFLELNNGKLQIVSGEGFWEKSNDKTLMHNMGDSFPGTIVNLVFNLTDKHSYYLESELTTVNNIF